MWKKRCMQGRVYSLMKWGRVNDYSTGRRKSNRSIDPCLLILCHHWYRYRQSLDRSAYPEFEFFLAQTICVCIHTCLCINLWFKLHLKLVSISFFNVRLIMASFSFAVHSCVNFLLVWKDENVESEKKKGKKARLGGTLYKLASHAGMRACSPHVTMATAPH